MKTTATLFYVERYIAEHNNPVPVYQFYKAYGLEFNKYKCAIQGDPIGWAVRNQQGELVKVLMTKNQAEKYAVDLSEEVRYQLGKN